MKNKFLIILILLFVPFLVNAETILISNTDVYLDFDNNWHVFTRDNIKDNKELQELDITYEDMYDFFTNNNAYLDAYVFTYDNNFIELFIRKVANNSITNLSLYDEKDVNSFVEEIAIEQNANDYRLSVINNYKFAELRYNSNGYYLREYVTVINNETYGFTFQKETSITEEENLIIDSLMDTINFNVKTRKEEEKTVYKKTDYSKIMLNTLIGALIGAGFGALLGFIVYIIKKNNKNNNNQNNNERNS